MLYNRLITNHVNTALVILALTVSAESIKIAELISNYARVSTNNGGKPETNTTLPHSSKNTTSQENQTNSTTDEDIPPDYEDFDDLQQRIEAEEEAAKQRNKESSERYVKMFNGIINLLSTLYRFTGRKPTKQEAQPRQQSVASYVNDMMAMPSSKQHKAYKPYQPSKQYAQERYVPNSFNHFYKKHKEKTSGSTKEQAPIKMSNAVVPDSDMYKLSDQNLPVSDVQNSYMPDDLKSSYDVDMEQYQNGQKDSGDQPPSDVNVHQSYSYQVDDDNSMAPEMTHQHKPSYDASVDVQSSHSYELPHNPWENKNQPKPEYQSWQPDAPKTPWKAEDMMTSAKNPSWGDSPPSPVYQPWNSPPTHQQSYPKPSPVYGGPGSNPQMPSPVQGDMNSAPPAPSNMYGVPMNSPPKPSPVYGGPMSPPPKSPSFTYGSPNPTPQQMPSDSGQGAPSWGGHSHPGDTGSSFDYSSHDVYDYHDHTEKPVMDDEHRESKRPYSYYFIARKLWYVPLIFSLYFIVYVGILILRSVSRHKINFPEKPWGDHGHDHEKGKDIAHDDPHMDPEHMERLDRYNKRLTGAIKKYKYM